MPDFTLHIDGMHCASCIRRLSQALATVEGLHVEEVLLGSARVSSNQYSLPLDQVASAILKAGFRLRDEKPASSSRILTLVR